MSIISRKGAANAALVMEKQTNDTDTEIIIRLAEPADAADVDAIYRKIHTAEEQGLMTTCWQRDIYPVYQTALTAAENKELYIMEKQGTILGAAIFNHRQVDVYAGAPWQYDAPEDQVLVMHTLAIDPDAKRQGLGTRFEQFYENLAKKMGCPYLRIDTNARNLTARTFYQKLGFREISIVPCLFNGLSGFELVLLEKALL